MNYNLIINEKEFDRFITILPETDDTTTYYITLLARKKYDTTELIKHDRAQLKRVLAKKHLIKSKIKQMQVEIGTYTYDNASVPEESLALYITPNPRNLHKASLKMLKEIADKLIEGQSISPHTLALNCIQTTSAKKKWFDIDIDFKQEYNIIETEHLVVEKINQIFQANQFQLVRTRGGFHLLVELETDLPKTWYQQIKSLACQEFDIMMIGDGLIPIAGCRQGGSSPRLI